MSDTNTNQGDDRSAVVSVEAPISVRRATRVIDGRWCDDGYSFIEEASTAGWKAVSAWGRDGWDLGDWPYVVYAFRGETERATYVEGDITLETFASSEARERATDISALWHWHVDHAAWADGVDPSDIPDHLRGPFSWKRLDADAA